jgi:hypothetical protein
MIPLVISSHFFLVPAYIAYKNSYYGYATISLITTIVSVNFWRNPIPGFRRNLDLVVAKISFTIRRDVRGWSQDTFMVYWSNIYITIYYI